MGVEVVWRRTPEKSKHEEEIPSHYWMALVHVSRRWSWTQGRMVVVVATIARVVPTGKFLFLALPLHLVFCFPFLDYADAMSLALLEKYIVSSSNVYSLKATNHGTIQLVDAFRRVSTLRVVACRSKIWFQIVPELGCWRNGFGLCIAMNNVCSKLLWESPTQLGTVMVVR